MGSLLMFPAWRIDAVREDITEQIISHHFIFNRMDHTNTQARPSHQRATTYHCTHPKAGKYTSCSQAHIHFYTNHTCISGTQPANSIAQTQESTQTPHIVTRTPEGTSATYWTSLPAVSCRMGCSSCTSSSRSSGRKPFSVPPSSPSPRAS